MHFTEMSAGLLPNTPLTCLPSILKQLQRATQEMISLITKETNMSKCVPDVFTDDMRICYHLTDEIHNVPLFGSQNIAKYVKMSSGKR